jgi:hypothetical protein
VGILSRPKNSWVADRTGFGPIDSGKTMGLSNSGLVDVRLSNELLAGAMEDEVTSAGVGVCEEVHHRRNGLMSKTWKGPENINEAEPSLACASLDSEVPDVVVSGGGQEESYVEDLAEDPGLVVLAPNSLGEASPVMKNLRLTKEVGSIFGLSCDGQEGLKMNCLKQIIVDQQGIEGGSPTSVDEQDVENSVRERGNCSDYKA